MGSEVSFYTDFQVVSTEKRKAVKAPSIESDSQTASVLLLLVLRRKPAKKGGG